MHHQTKVVHGATGAHRDGALAAAIALGMLLAGPTPGTAEAPLRCDTSGRTIRSNSVARVFRTPPRKAHRYYGCLREPGQVFPIVRVVRSAGYHFELPRLSGAYFAAHVWNFSSQASAVSLWDLATGRRTYWGTNEEDYVGADLEVTANGAVAWVTDGDDVWKADNDGPAMIGRADRRSKRSRTLTLTGDTVSWRERGSMVSYVLKGRATQA
jgi:hypothetical protein